MNEKIEEWRRIIDEVDVELTVLGVVGTRKPNPDEFTKLEGVREVVRISKDD